MGAQALKFVWITWEWATSCWQVRATGLKSDKGQSDRWLLSLWLCDCPVRSWLATMLPCLHAFRAELLPKPHFQLDGPTLLAVPALTIQLLLVSLLCPAPSRPRTGLGLGARPV